MLRMITLMPEARAGFDKSLYSPQDNNCEVINGKLSVIPNPGTKHQHVSIRLTAILFQRLENEGLGAVLGPHCNVMLSPWDILQPDVLFVRENRRGIIGGQIILGPPDLVVEILSDDTWEKDMKIKRKIYADSGVREYWIVDPEAGTIEPHIWSEIGYISYGIHGKRACMSTPLLPDLELPLLKIFRQ